MPENGYQILQIDALSVLDAAKNPEPGQRIWFAFGEGQRGHVDIPDRLLTPQRKDAMIQAYVDKVMALWG
jgi:hypothetical protein